MLGLLNCDVYNLSVLIFDFKMNLIQLSEELPYNLQK